MSLREGLEFGEDLRFYAFAQVDTGSDADTAREGRAPHGQDRQSIHESPLRVAQPFRPHVGAGLVPARRGDLGDAASPGECVPPGGVPRGDRPSWAFPLGWVSGGEEIAIFPSRVSFLFASFSLDKQRERISVSPRIRRRAQETKAVPRGRPQGRSEAEGAPTA